MKWCYIISKCNYIPTQAQALTLAEQVKSIPAVVVDGQYLTHLGLTKDPARLTQVLDYLVAKSKKPQ